MRLSTISLLASFIYLAAADVQFTTPSPGGSVAGSGTISVAWEEGTGTTKISQLAGWTLTLFAGGETETAAQPVGTAVTGDHTSGTKTTTFTITPAAGPSGTNAYYFKMMSTATTGGQMINYSERFSLTGMTGAWQSQTIEDAWNSVKGDPSKVPAAQDQVTSNQNDPGAAGQGGPEYSVSYQFQTTGLTKYAPMQVHAPTAITKQDTAALFPTSLFIVAQTNLPVPSQLTTLTASRTYSYSTQVNSATPAPAPSNDMQKFLARWKD